MEGMEKKNARERMQGCLLSLILPAGVMAGLDTVEKKRHEG